MAGAEEKKDIQSEPDVKIPVLEGAQGKPSVKFSRIRKGARRALDVITFKNHKQSKEREAKDLRERIELGGKVTEREDGSLDFSPNAGMMYKAFADAANLAMKRKKTVHLYGNNEDIFVLSPESIEEKLKEGIEEGLESIPDDAYICYDEDGSTVERFTTAARMALDKSHSTCFAGKDGKFYRVDYEKTKKFFERVRREFLQA